MTADFPLSPWANAAVAAAVAITVATIAHRILALVARRASLLASAGVVGIVASIAARPVFSNIIAGLQIALAQPLRIDDVPIVERQMGPRGRNHQHLCGAGHMG